MGQSKYKVTFYRMIITHTPLLLMLISSISGALYFADYHYLALGFLTLCIIYIIFYYYHKLDITLTSWIAFLVNSTIFGLFIYGIFNIYYKGLPPIYVEDLSVFSYYRYLSFLVLTVLTLLVYFLFKNYPSMNSLVKYFTFPYLKEELRLILDLWKYSSFLCSRLLNLLQNKRYFFSMYFLIIYTFRFIQAIFFMNFAFLHGDLRFNLYLLPFSFCIWFFRFMEYYFMHFLSSVLAQFRLILDINVKNFESDETLIYCKLSDLTYKLTPFGISEGFYQSHIVFKQWLNHIKVYVYYLKLKKYTKYIDISIIFINLFSWCFIISTYSNNIEQTLWPFIRRSFSTTSKLLSNHMRHIKEDYQNNVKNDSQGKHSPGHPVYGDYNKAGDKFIADGSATHGTPPHPHIPLGKQQPTDKSNTSAIPFDTPVEIPKEYVGKEVPNSTAFLEEHKEKLPPPSSKE